MDNGNNNAGVQSGVSECGTLHLLKRIPLTKEYGPRIEWLWERLKTQDYAFDDLTRGNGQFWLNKLVSQGSEHYELGDEGYVMVDNIVPKLNANIHFAIWGTPAPGKVVSAAKELIDHLFETYNLNRITAMCPNVNKAAARIATIMRFKYEGELRGAFLYYGQYYGVSIYGLLHDTYNKREVVN